MHLPKTLLLCLVLQFPAVALDHHLALRLGGSIDRNIGLIQHQSQPVQASQITASLMLGLIYDFFPSPFLSISPELHFVVPRSLKSDAIHASWSEITTGIQLKINLNNLLYVGMGAGIGFAQNPRLPHTHSSSYPYLVVELGSNTVFKQFSGAAGKKLLLGLHLALRGTTNISTWKDTPKLGHLQNDFAIGLLLGFSLFYGESWLYI
jgi:hypothetical protein